PRHTHGSTVRPWELERLEDRTVPAFTVGQNFAASTLLSDSFALPPDSEGSVGLNHYVEFINGRFKVFNKSDASIALSLSDSSFWTSKAGVSLSGVSFISDPRL